MDLFEDRKAEPMLIAEQIEAFDSPGWIYELKPDGERELAYLSNSVVDFRNKRQMLLLPNYPELAEINKQVKDRCILDGEFVIFEDGKPNFSKIQRRLMMSDKFKIKLHADRYPASFVAYDILYLGNESLLDLPLMERKRILGEMVVENPRIAISRYMENAGIKLFELTKQQGLEGIVAKRKWISLYKDRRENFSLKEGIVGVVAEATR